MENMFEEKIIETDAEKESLEREIPSAVQQLNERLGIKDKESLMTGHEIKSIQEMVENSKREFEKFKEDIAAQKIAIEGDEEHASMAVIRNENPLTKGPGTAESAKNAITTFAESIGVMSSLAQTGQDIMVKLYDAIASTDLIDPDVIESTAKIIEGIRVAVADIINYHNTKMQLEHSYRMAIDMENLKQSNRKELEILKSFLRRQEAEEKHKQKIEDEKLKATPAEAEVKDVPATGMTWKHEEIMDMLRAHDEELLKSKQP